MLTLGALTHDANGLLGDKLSKLTFFVLYIPNINTNLCFTYIFVFEAEKDKMKIF